MYIGLYNLEPQIVNSAMMRVSQYHKEQGDLVEKYNHLLNGEYDRIYAFSIFDFTDKSMVRKNMLCGGSGFDLKTKLPCEIEKCCYDWSLYPDCDFSLIWFSHGCIRKCPFCCVPQKEGSEYSSDPKNLNPNGKYIKVMDNNFFANPNWRSSINQLQNWKKPCDFQGVDVRLLNKEKCDALLSLKHYKQIHIAWDDPRENLIPKIKEVIRFIKPYRLMCYILIGYWSTEKEDLYRIEELEKLGIDQFVMPYNKRDPKQINFSRYVNHKAIRNSVTWRDYKKSIRKTSPIPPDVKTSGILGGIL
jgi:hypothetical protein